MAKVYDFVSKSAAEFRADYLRTYRVGLINRGVANPNVSPGSDEYIRADALANELVVVSANTIIKADDLMPDTATEADLARLAAIYGLTKQAAAGSIGTVVLDSSQSTTVLTGSELVDDEGLRYEVTVGGTYADGAVIPIAAVDTGERTNHAVNDVLRWATAPAYADEKALVGTGGLVNGIDEEDDEVLRSRLISYLQNPPRSGNWEHLAEIAEASSPSVQKTFVYPAIQGGSTYGVAVCAAPTEDSKSRVVATATMTGIITPSVIGLMPTHAYYYLTTVTDVNADVAFGLILPEAPTANPPGPGGGWIDGNPWPSVDGSATFRVRVTAVTSSTVFTVEATTSPQIGVSHVAWFSPTDWTLYRAVVSNVSGTSGAYVITLDRPFPSIAVGCYIFPDSENAELYCATILEQFALMGPGEKTSNASSLLRGFRHPKPSAAWPYTLGSAQLRTLSSSHEEVEAVQFFHRTDGTTTVTGTAGSVTPQVPASVSDAPNIFVPRHLGFYRIPS